MSTSFLTSTGNAHIFILPNWEHSIQRTCIQCSKMKKRVLRASVGFTGHLHVSYNVPYYNALQCSSAHQQSLCLKKDSSVTDILKKQPLILNTQKFCLFRNFLQSTGVEANGESMFQSSVFCPCASADMCICPLRRYEVACIRHCYKCIAPASS